MGKKPVAVGEGIGGGAEGAALELRRGDITLLEADAIVNAANAGLWGGGGVDGAIHRAAGPSLAEDCALIRARQGGCPVGQAVMTPGGRLKARFVIHTVGPVWRGGGEGEEGLLRDCYRNSLRLAEELGLASIAFPNISTGVYGFPKGLAADIVVGYLSEAAQGLVSLRKILLVCFDEENYCLYASRLALVG
jgi:O-acetyl-ADP-ribose deacetylase